jgi:hypothetical protein
MPLFKVCHSSSSDVLYNAAEGINLGFGSWHNLERFAIACTDKPPRLTCDSGTIWQIVPHTQMQTALGAGLQLAEAGKNCEKRRPYDTRGD